MKEVDRSGGHKRDFRVAIAGLADPLEITNAGNGDHATTIALDYLARTGRRGFTAANVTLVEKLPTDPGRHEARAAEAKAQGRELGLAGARSLPGSDSKAVRQGTAGVEPSGRSGAEE